MTDHGRRDLISSWLDGRLSAEESARLEQDLLHSRAARDEFRAWADLDSLLVQQAEAGQNNSGVYRNAKVEELTLKAGTEMDPKKRLEMLVEAQKIHKDEYGHIPLHQQTLAWGVRDEVIHDSVKPRPSNDVDLRQVKVK